MPEEKAEELKNTVDDQLTAFDKKYSYLICVSLTISFISMYCHISSNGIIFRQFIDSHENGVENFTVVLGCMMVLMQVSGVLASIFLKYFALRDISICCSVIYVFAWFSLYFTDSMIHIFFAYGILIPLTTGVLTTLCFSIFNTYFTDNRNFVMSCCQIFVGCATTAFPLLAQYLIAEYGFKYFILTFSGLSSLTVLATFCMHPVGWRVKKPTTYEAVDQSDKKISANEYKLIEVTNKLEKEKDIIQLKAKNIRFTTRIINYFDLTLFKDIYFINLIVFEAMVVSCDSTFITVFTQRFKTIGFDLVQTARCTAIFNGSDLFARLFLAVITKRWKLCARDLFLCGITAEGILWAIYAYSTSYWNTVILSSLMGFFRPFLHLMMPLVCAEYDEEKFTVIYGLMNVFASAFNIMAVSFIRTLQVIYNGFDEILYTISSLMLLTAISWIIELWFKGKKSFK